MTTKPKRTRSGGLDRVNVAFHSQYDRATEVAETMGPVLVLLADTLFAFRGAARSQHPVTPPAFHAIKSAAHAPVAAYAAVVDGVDSPLNSAAKRALLRLRSSSRDSLGDLATNPKQARADVRSALDLTITFIDRALAAGRVQQTVLAIFAKTSGPVLLRLTEHATRVQLQELHRVVQKQLASLSRLERKHVQVVVAGAHQARIRSLGMQYFQKRFGERPGVEKRVAYAEGINTAEDALALVGKRRLDGAIATAFFGDESRLQRDILGDAAKAVLSRARLARIL